MHYPPPPPYVPPEYHRCKYSEIPEPYRSQIDLWIEATTRYHEENARHARTLAIMVFIGTIALAAFAVYALLSVKG